MKRYETYRETVSPFLKEVPSHWMDIKIGHGYATKSIGNNQGEQLLSVFLNRGVVSYTDTDMKQVHKPSEDMSAYQLVEPGDFVLNNQQAWRGSVGVSSYRGIVSPAYIVMMPKDDYNPRFMNYMLRETACIAQLVLASKGVGSIQRILSPIKLKSSIMVLPPRTEQDQIVRYLDWQVSKINRLIAAKKKQIVLLKEQTIRTKNDLLLGQNTSTKMQETGSNWMPSIPSGWQLSKIGKHFAINKRIAGKEGYDVLSITQQGLKVKNIASKEGQIAADYSGYQFVYPGDFAMNHMDLLTGYVGLAEQFGVTSPDYRVFTVNDPAICYPRYYLALFELCYKRRIFYGYGRGAAAQGRWRLPAVNFRNFIIPVPTYDEQVAIVEAIEANEKATTAAIINIEDQIANLVDLRTRLISDVVTGQIDVRGVEIPDFEYITESDDNSEDGDDEESEEMAEEEV